MKARFYATSKPARGHQEEFDRLICRPAEVDEANAKASMKDGMLELTLPKLEKSKRRTINITMGEHED